MRFKVSRTSVFSEEAAPCPEAFAGSEQFWDRRSFKSPEEHDEKLPKMAPWANRGTEHGFWYQENGKLGGIQRRMEDRPAWFVNIAGLKQLMEFVENHGQIIIQESYSGKPPEIEIYDDYRE